MFSRISRTARRGSIDRRPTCSRKDPGRPPTESAAQLVAALERNAWDDAYDPAPAPARSPRHRSPRHRSHPRPPRSKRRRAAWDWRLSSCSSPPATVAASGLPFRQSAVSNSSPRSFGSGTPIHSRVSWSPDSTHTVAGSMRIEMSSDLPTPPDPASTQPARCRRHAPRPGHRGHAHAYTDARTGDHRLAVAAAPRPAPTPTPLAIPAVHINITNVVLHS